MSDIYDSGSQAGVEIDGGAIRRIREEKRLTQLYVSKVVGVTTDTVSRWENNRYPTIRKDNAQKLAEALEVDLDEILLIQHPGENSQETISPSAPPQNSKIFIYLMIAGIFFFAVIAGLYAVLGRSPSVEVLRYLPVYAAPGSSVLLRVQIDSKQEMKVILKESIPARWEYSGSYPASSKIDSEHSTVRWIFKNSSAQKNIYYRLLVPPEASAGTSVTITGQVVTHSNGRQSQVKINSAQTMTIAPFHWADRNADNVIDDMEILTVSDYAEEAGDELVGWDELELLWEAGHYRWDSRFDRFVPVASLQ